MNKNIVYILGAGFSAPLDIPTMSNFIDKARQLRRGVKKYEYFDEVISLAQNTATTGTYFQHDSRNIEEALSLLEMKDQLEGTSTKAQLLQFIVDVIEGYTPQLPSFSKNTIPMNYEHTIFSGTEIWQGYCAFVASLTGLDFYRGPEFMNRGLLVHPTQVQCTYSIISLNYDLVLENICEALMKSYTWEQNSEISFVRTLESNSNPNQIPLIKIHGSIDTNDIIPPTYNKGLYGSQLPISWRQAYDLLARANEIRIIGYSLPQTDSYIKYLLMASIDKLKDLDRIDWIVRDTRATVQQRIQEFIRFQPISIVRADVSSYLKTIFGFVANRASSESYKHLIFNSLEEAHEQFIRSNTAATA